MDSIEVADKINRNINRPINIMIEVLISEEESKTGV